MPKQGFSANWAIAFISSWLVIERKDATCCGMTVVEEEGRGGTMTVIYREEEEVQHEASTESSGGE